MKFAKTFTVERYKQIVMIKKQNEIGAPEIRFFFHPDGFGICEFAIGWNEDDNPEHKVEQAFNKITLQQVIEIVDGYMKHMAEKKKDAH